MSALCNFRFLILCVFAIAYLEKFTSGSVTLRWGLYFVGHCSCLSSRKCRAGNTVWNSVFQYLGTTGGTFRYWNTEYNIDTDTGTDWMIPNDFFGIFEFPAPTKNLHMVDRGIRHLTILAMRDKCYICWLEIARNCYHARHRPLRRETAQTQTAVQTPVNIPRQLYLKV